MRSILLIPNRCLDSVFEGFSARYSVQLLAYLKRSEILCQFVFGDRSRRGLFVSLQLYLRVVVGKGQSITSGQRKRLLGCGVKHRRRPAFFVRSRSFAK
jgi:hypothetical protein